MSFNIVNVVTVWKHFRALGDEDAIFSVGSYTVYCPGHEVRSTQSFKNHIWNGANDNTIYVAMEKAT